MDQTRADLFNHRNNTAIRKTTNLPNTFGSLLHPFEALSRRLFLLHAVWWLRGARCMSSYVYS